MALVGKQQTNDQFLLHPDVATQRVARHFMSRTHTLTFYVLFQSVEYLFVKIMSEMGPHRHAIHTPSYNITLFVLNSGIDLKIKGIFQQFSLSALFDLNHYKQIFAYECAQLKAFWFLLVVCFVGLSLIWRLKKHHILTAVQFC